ncbi:neuronal-specific septin-3-like isoform X2 [Phaenicophaeus curvirostris]|uniref:neuronal-specific septin-3-like isoform X2 n=1 Tax=Phaenicophaeus curvirostris TaxID=33595 RepID=UPI0037F0B455
MPRLQSGAHANRQRVGTGCRADGTGLAGAAWALRFLCQEEVGMHRFLSWEATVVPSWWHPWGSAARLVLCPAGRSSKRAGSRRVSLPRRASAWVTHAGPGARRRRRKSGGGAALSALHPRSHLAPVTSSQRQQPRLQPAHPESSLEPEEHSMEPPAVPEEEMPLTAASGPEGCQLFGYVGIEAVLDQMKIKTMKTGFEFNIMVVGQSGLGKSTMVNTLFKSKVSRKASQPGQEERIPKTVQLQSVTHVIEEKGVKMKLTVTDTPGFGDQINNENCWDPIIKYINEQYEKYLREEILITRKRKIPDTRVHGCVYFIPPTGHWLRPLDLEFMRRLSKIVNVVPVIAKADTLTLEERAEFKQRIQEDLKTHAISVYPQEDFDQDPDDRALNDRIREEIPFAVVGADQEHQVNGKRVLGRKTKWGIIEVENPAHCEFPLLRDLLIRSHLQDLKDITHNVHYESYRVRRLNESNQLALSPLNGLPGKGEGGSHL